MSWALLLEARTRFRLCVEVEERRRLRVFGSTASRSGLKAVAELSLVCAGESDAGRWAGLGGTNGPAVVGGEVVFG